MVKRSWCFGLAEPSDRLIRSRPRVGTASTRPEACDMLVGPGSPSVRGLQRYEMQRPDAVLLRWSLRLVGAGAAMTHGEPSMKEGDHRASRPGTGGEAIRISTSRRLAKAVPAPRPMRRMAFISPALAASSPVLGSIGHPVSSSLRL